MYCTLADIEKKRIPTDMLITLTDEENLGVINEETVAGCIHDAQVLFEGYMRGRYQLPLNPVPPLATSIVADLTCFNLYALKPQFEVPKTINDRNDTALRLMARIQDGKMPLYDPVEAPPATGSNSVQFTTPASVFTSDSLRNF
ncbi:MAG: hypothetical protein A2076_13160 [Geobacteraceae bacterium GWC2_53_11]|nr:MAG: hypothetical protein A2076_13160 [Geobacteraceae bacterium GWC2_53_11]